ncbi:MAG: hypothetical protein V1489_01080, partial [Candidatus Liptonbacteria bacterium]
MNINRSLSKKILLFAAIFVVAAVILPALLPHFASAAVVSTNTIVPPGGVAKLGSVCGITGLLTAPLLCASYFMLLLYVSLAGVGVGMAAWLVQFATNLSDEVAGMPTVAEGFKISLSIANLGFVLGIIVIAIATILRLQSYGMKQLLLKLVAMAILVNFSMVIAGGLISASDSLADYFLKAGSSATDPGIAPIVGFVNSMTASMGPNKLFQTSTSSESVMKMMGEKAGELLSGYSEIINMFFILIFLLLIFFVFIILALMMLVRYVYLVILLILMPLAWMAWVFPNLSHLWAKWWNKFFRWTFFPPIVFFFIYLAIITTTNVGYIKDKTGSPRISSADDPVAIFTKAFMANAEAPKSVGTIIIGTILIYGGLFAANAMGIEFARQAMNTMTGVGKAVGKTMWNKGRGTTARGLGAREGTKLPANATWRQRLMQPFAYKRT